MNGFNVMSSSIVIAAILSAPSYAAPAAPEHAPAPSVSLYGIELGKPLSIDECVIAHSGAGQAREAGLCFHKSTQFLPPTDPAKLREAYIVFPVGQAPEDMKRGEFRVQILGDTVEEIVISTKGIEVQGRLLEQLRSKFGPGKIEHVVMQNGFGAKFDVIRAEWSFGDRWVHFDGDGIIIATTAKAEKLEKEKEAAKAATAPKL